MNIWKLQEFARGFDPEIRVEIATEPACDIYNKIIYYAPFATPTMKYHTKVISRLYKQRIHMPSYLFAFLHELGHIVTTNHLDDTDLQSVLYADFIAKEEITDPLVYRNQPLEKLADEFALKYLQLAKSML